MSLILIGNIIFMYFYLEDYIKNNDVKNKNNLLSFTLYILLPVTYIVIYSNLQNSLEIAYLWTISTILSLIIFTDLVDMVIPDRLIILMTTITLVYRVISHYLYKFDIDLVFYIGGCLLASLIFIIIYVGSKGGIGQGDITLIGALGFILGPYLVILNIFLSFLIGAMVSIFLLASRIKSHKDPIPFGPFIIIGFYISRLYGSQIISWYMGLL